MNPRISVATRWFGFGVYASWASGMILGELFGETTGRWSGEVGLYFGLVAAVFMAAVTSLPFAGWLAVRRWWTGTSQNRTGICLVLGLSHALLFVGCAMGVFHMGFNKVAGPIIVMSLCLGSPIAMAEISLRLARWRNGKPRTIEL